MSRPHDSGSPDRLNRAGRSRYPPSSPERCGFQAGGWRGDAFRGRTHLPEPGRKTGCRQRGFRIATAMTLTTQKGSVPDFDCFGNEEIVLISRFFIHKYNYISFTDFPQSSTGIRHYREIEKVCG